ncbi:MAG: START domain-containing protein [Gammaproteobacteria bacterium]|nr:START domain-containing protein [Gammaproteobacteria bacterium]
MKLLAIAFLLCTAPCLSTFANDNKGEQWKLRKDKNGIQVFSRKVAGSKYEEFKGVVELNATLASSLALLDDTEACPDWIHQCESGKVLQRTGWLERHIYQVSDLPFPAASRDMIFKATVRQTEVGNIRIDLQCKPDFIQETGYIRITESYGSYLLEKLAENRTRLTWVQYVDPAGALPAFMVNSMLTDVPFKSLVNFKKVVKRDKYRDAKFVHHEDGSLSLSR